MEEKSALEQAIAASGNQATLAKAIGVSQQAISYWMIKGKRVPAEWVPAVEKASGVSRHLLRPDVFGPAEAVA